MEIVKALLIHLVVPLVGLWIFMRLLGNMREAGIAHPPVVPLFLIFAAYGGWLMVALTLLFWYWSGMALVGTLCLLFLVPIVMIGIAVWLYPRRKLSPYHYGSFWASAGYTIIPVGVLVSRIIWGAMQR